MQKRGSGFRVQGSGFKRIQGSLTERLFERERERERGRVFFGCKCVVRVSKSFRQSSWAL